MTHWLLLLLWMKKRMDTEFTYYCMTLSLITGHNISDLNPPLSLGDLFLKLESLHPWVRRKAAAKTEFDCRVGGWIRLIVGFQLHMVISPTASWIRWCMQVYTLWFNVDLSCLGRTIYARQFLDTKPPIQFRHRWAERNHSGHLYWLRAAQSDA